MNELSFFRSSQKALLLAALCSLGLVNGLKAQVRSILQTDVTGSRPVGEVSNSSDPIQWAELGARVTTEAPSQAISIVSSADGIRLHTGFQKLNGTVTSKGLTLLSTEAEGGTLHLVADAIGRDGNFDFLNNTGKATAGVKRAIYIRPGLTEEYSVSADGIRQDFIVQQRPSGTGELQVGLDLNGAKAVAAPYGVEVTLTSSGRKLAYSRLRVTDAAGKELSASLIVTAEDRLVVHVEDADAVYPVRIDPTFSDADWVSMNSGLPGADGFVLAAVADASGNIYVGGNFSVIGNVTANRIAKWNGSEWSALGDGLNDWVRALAFVGNDLYAGGDFTTGAGPYDFAIAKWNGTAWSYLPGGMDSNVYSLAVSGTDLYAAGPFVYAGTTYAHFIAKWDGTTWSALGAGLSGYANVVVADGTDIYAGGTFHTAGGISAQYIAKWNGSSWSALGSGVDNYVYALAKNGNNLYVGGNFNSAGGIAASKIAKWNGTTWSTVGSGMDNVVYALALNGTDLYAGGDFTTAGGVSAKKIAKWNGSGWSALGSGTNGSVRVIELVGSTVFAGGRFNSAGGKAAGRIAEWGGGQWSSLGSGLNEQVTALAVKGTDLFVGGNFISTGTVPANRIAKWDGSQWSALGAGLNNTVLTLEMDGNDLFVGGDFTTAGGVQANRVAKWSGGQWSALGTGMNKAVNALKAKGGLLYAAGDFTTAGGITVGRIATWTGSDWAPLGTGLNYDVHALAIMGNELYAGGEFTAAGDAPASEIAKWDGTNWSSLGAGMSPYGEVDALAVIGNDLYAGGSFYTAGGIPAKDLARWNGTEWSALGDGLTNYGTVLSMVPNGDELYVGGSFSETGGIVTNNIAKWDGSNWSALGSGTDGIVNALAVLGSGLYVGGSFIHAGSTFSPYIVKGIIGENAQPCSGNQVVLTIHTDGQPQQTTWTITDENEVLVASGGPCAAQANMLVCDTICLGDSIGSDRYHFRVFDSGGDGIDGGGYVLTDINGQRILDADGQFGSTSYSGADLGLPLGPVSLAPQSCDLEDYTLAIPLVCTPVANATKYQFWLFDPHGSFSHKFVRNTPQLGPYPMAQVPNLPALNVRVRAKVNVTATEYGPACRLTFAEGPMMQQRKAEREAANRMALWPNPNNGNMVELTVDVGDENIVSAEIALIDATGRTMLSRQIVVADGKIDVALDLGGVADGVYLMRVSAGESNWNRKLEVGR